MYKINEIINDFMGKCNSDRSLFKKYMSNAVNSIRELTTDESAVCDFIVIIMRDDGLNEKISFNEFKYILQLDIDLSYDIYSIFFSSCFYEKPDIFFYILNNYDVYTEVAELGYTQNINIKILEYLFEEGLLQNNINEAVVNFYGHTDKLKLFLDYGADLNYFIENTRNMELKYETLIFILDTIKTAQYSLNSESPTILLELIVSKYYYDLPNIFDYIRMLVDLGADPCRESIFLEACENLLNAEIIRYFIEDCGCDINMKNSEALYRASINQFSRKDIFKLLLDMGIKVSNWAIDEAIQCGNEYVNLLIDYGVPPERIAAITVDIHISVFKNLVQKGVDYNKIIQESTSDVESLV